MKVLVIGSGPIVIGQAAEFDYAGTQACKSLKEEGHEVVLINSNPATIMTDPGVADALYIEPLNVDFCERVIARERPDALLPTLGGQTGLNLATQLADQGILEKYNVKVLGTPLSAIKKAEDRESFRNLMREIKEPVPESWIIQTEQELQDVLDKVPYPCIIRPAYTLGGTGGGIANTREELWETGRKGLKLSMRSQLMVERSLLGWKEVEYEVMRDKAGNCITVCNMENLDPMGVHTGDSIVIAPSQTLSDIEYHMLRTASLKIIQALGIEGGCNVQLAFNPESFDYYIIEVNPRVSRSSALASKATGYPIARVAAKIAVGKTLDEIENQVTGTTKACFEPALDYVVVKIPRWPFDKFASGDRSLFTQMKATGEVMAIDRSFEAAFMKAIRGLEIKQKDLRHTKFQGTGLHQDRGTGGSPVSVSDGPSEIEKRQGAYLPHWTKEGAIYSITYRLADSVPSTVRDQWKAEREDLAKLESEGKLSDKDKFEFQRLLSQKVDDFLDSGAGECVLRDPKIATIVVENLKHFQDKKYRLHAWCVMPNHVHVIVEPLQGESLPEILHSWKSFTAKAINKELGRSGELWQSEYYDHLIRDDSGYGHCVQYVLDNPRKAGLENWMFVDSHSLGQAAPDTHGRAARATTERMSDDDLRHAISKPTDERLWALAEGLRRDWGIEEVHRLSNVDNWFLRKIDNLLVIEEELIRAQEALGQDEELNALIEEAFLLGYPSSSIASLLGIPTAYTAWNAKRLRGNDKPFEMPSEDYPDATRKQEFLNYWQTATEAIESQKVKPVFKMVDTCAGEFESQTPYYYGTFEQEDDAVTVLTARH